MGGLRPCSWESACISERLHAKRDGDQHDTRTPSPGLRPGRRRSGGPAVARIRAVTVFIEGGGEAREARRESRRESRRLVLSPHEGCAEGSAEGGGLFESRHPTAPLQTPPPVFEPVFLQLEVLGKTAGATGAGKKFLASQGGNTQNFAENSKMGGKNTKKIYPRPPGQTLADGSLS